jgi:shikimate dehydrogenase
LPAAGGSLAAGFFCKPDQVEQRRCFKIKEVRPMIDTYTQLFGVIGNPVRHSLGPAMHNRALTVMGYPAVYLAFEVADVAAAMVGMRSLGIGGLSVTIPHKVAVMQQLDEVDDLALRIGAVNTVVNRDGRLIGYNTDCFGAVAALKEKTTLLGHRVAVLGAGGAARAVGFGLAAEGALVTIFNRDSSRGEALARALGVDFCPLADFSRKVPDIVVNTTSVGMWPNVQVMPISEDVLSDNLVVMDIVYNPLETALLRAAQKRGCRTVDGVAMFVLQGARQLELWTGQAAPTDSMRSAVVDALAGRNP